MNDELPTLVITGASSGIGLALAKKLATLTDRYRIVLSAREQSMPALKKLIHGLGIDHRILELTDPKSCEDFMNGILADYGGIDVLINNAGISYRTVVEHLDHDEEAKQMRTNFFGPLQLIRMALPYMRSQHYGRIINVSSVGGMMAMPTMGIYSASKFALEGLSESLWYEMRPWGIHVSLVQPGFVRSDSFRHVLLSRHAQHAIDNKDAYYNYYLHMGKFIERLMKKATATPEKVADKIIDLLDSKSPALRSSVGLDAHFFGLLRRWLPRGIYHRLLYALLPGIHRWGTGIRDEEKGDSFANKSRKYSDK